jgi:predicted alpha/beta-hydrolase family hydrolase
MSQLRVCFSHGKESGPWGTKIKALASIAEQVGWQVESLDYQGMDDPHEREELLRRWCADCADPYVLAGSSMGGHVAAAVASQAQSHGQPLGQLLGLFLMAPAFYVPGYEELTPAAPGCPVVIVHGWHDEVIPWQNSARYGAAADARVVFMNSDHRLVDVLPQLGQELKLFLDSLVNLKGREE